MFSRCFQDKVKEREREEMEAGREGEGGKEKGRDCPLSKFNPR